ncbi:MAG: lipoyl domain-containing protein [Bacteroidales bacterium]|nr:lipoyl domain-containing protein [Bacteroidales bacterium]
MVYPVMMPKQGQSVESCIVSEFRKKPGDTVKAGDVLFGYETDKATFEEEAKVEGAAGLVKDRREMRRIVAKSFDLKLFIPGR